MSKDNAADIQDIKKSLKATSLFGGVQIFSILISIIRTKIVAVLIGPVGVGIVELYTSTINLIKSFSDFSLQISAVRDVSIAYKSGDPEKFSQTAALVTKIVWFTGILGTVICLLGSPFWSKLTFGDYSYTLGFAVLSCILLINQLERGNVILLQSTEHYKYLAFSGVIGNMLGLLTTVPIYYFLGIDGIIPVLIITAATAYILSYYYVSKIEIKRSILSNKYVVNKGREMLRQGFLISVNYLLSALVFYVLRIFITDRGGVAELGLYSAGFAVVNTYVGLVFQAMSQEYYPRISALSSDKVKFNNAINNQVFITLLILGPLVSVFLAFSDYILSLLYSEKFVGASTLMAISMVGVLFQAPSWCMSYSMLARGDNKTFLIFETIAKMLRIIMDICFYLVWGLTGLGVSFFLSYVYYTVQCSWVCYNRHQFFLMRRNILLLVAFVIIGLSSIIIYENVELVYRLFMGISVVLLVSSYSYNQLNKIINIKSFILSKVRK